MEEEILALHDRFCAGFAARDADAILATVLAGPEMAIVTSEEHLLRGEGEIAGFVRRYAKGSTTYSWTWERREVVAQGDVGWLLAVGTETASSEGAGHETPYRMTIVARRAGEDWLLAQVHGSSPHET